MKIQTQNSAVTSLLSEYAVKIEAAVRADILSTIGGGRTTKPADKAFFSREVTLGRVKGAKRDPEAIGALTKALQAYVSKHPGQRIEQIAVGMQVSTRELNLPVKKLQAEKLLHSRGQKRATTYSLKRG